jgi:endonuclease YncB( thermonuclease family)
MVKKRIEHWIDGDTGRFTDGRFFRLARVHAPEHYQFGGITATKRAAGMTAQSRGFVHVNVVGDSYGRQVVEMRNQHGSINNRLIARGCRNKGR